MESMKRKIRLAPFAIFFLIPFLLFIAAISLGDSGYADGINRSIHNIETFTRLYGYVRCFYPGDEAAALDWERFAIYGAKKVEGAQNDETLKIKLEELFLPMAPALKIYKSGQEAHFTVTDIAPPKTDGMNVIAWQHYGLGFGKANSIYKSVRLNRKTLVSSDEKAGSFASDVDAAHFRNKEIKLRAAMKTVAGRGQLYLLVDREKGQQDAFEIIGDHPIQYDRWEYFEKKVLVADDATQIWFGCFLSGSGELYVDDFQVFVKKDSQGEEWESVPIKNPGFEGDKEGDPPSQWFARKMLSYSLQVTSAAAAEGKKSVSIKSQAAFLTGPLPNFEDKPKIGDHVTKDLGSGLSCLMPIALYGTDIHTYPLASEDKLSRLLAAIEQDIPKKPEQIIADDLYVRLADIAMAWNVFQHFYPYFDVVKTDWRAALTEAMTDAYSDKNQRDFLKTLRKFTAKLKDGHVRVNVQRNTFEDHLLPLSWDWIENRLVITKILDKTLSDIHNGDVVEKINGVSVKDALAQEAQYISAATQGWMQRRSLAALLAGEKNKKFQLKIKRDGRTSTETLCASLSVQEYYALLSKDAIKSKKLEEGIYYLDLTQISMEEINGLMPELQKAKAIICDLRGYPNGNHNLIIHLLKTKDTAQWMWIPRIIYPDYEQVTYDKMGWSLEPSEPTLSAKMVFLTDGRAISYAESYMGYIEGYKLATIVGQPTAGTNGNINPFTLPGGYSISWTGMRVVKLDGSQHHGVGIVPNVPVERTINGVKAGRDEYIEKALEIARQ
jgi:C-terminal processing protease CtpA/Prc